MSERCKEMVWDNGHYYRCENPAKYGEYCGVHSPEKRREREKARGPSVFEKERVERQNLQDKARRAAFLEIAELAAKYDKQEHEDEYIVGSSCCYYAGIIEDECRRRAEELKGR